MGDITSVLREFDEVLYHKITACNHFTLLDASSLLWKLEVMGVEPGEKRWAKVTDALTTRASYFWSPWLSAHVMMSFAWGNVSEASARLTLAQGMLKSMEDYCADGGAFNQRMCEKLGVPVCNALLAFGEKKYDEVLQIMVPLRHDLWQIGGSWAQRQVFNSTMIEAAIRANNLPAAIGLVAELADRKPQNQRLRTLLDKLRTSHQQETCQPPAKKIKTT